MIYKQIALLLLINVIGYIPLYSQQYSDRIVKSFRINNSSTIDIYNKYGKIHIVTWDKDTAKFVVNLKIKTSSDSKLKKLKSNIDFDFTGTSYYVTAKTKIGKSRGIFSDIKDIAESLMAGDNHVTIDYVVMIPKYVNLKMENKFGDVYIDDFDGNVSLSLSNGELKANNLNGNTVIHLNQGDGVINSVKDGRFTVSYSDLHIKNSNKLTIDSRSSKIKIDKIDFLKLQSRRDKFYLPEIADLYGESYFSEFTIQSFSNELNYNFTYGDISIDAIDKNFSFINIISENTDINLIFDRGSAYEIDISHHEDVILNYPRQLGKLQSKVIDEDNKQVLTYGNIGTGTPSSKVKISAPKKCTINIIQK